MLVRFPRFCLRPHFRLPPPLDIERSAYMGFAVNSPAIKRHPVLKSACSRRLLRKKLLYIVRHPPTMVPINVPVTPMTAVRMGTSMHEI